MPKHLELALPIKKNRLFHRDDKLSKSQRASKTHYWFKSYGNFTDGWILPIGGVTSGRVCACSLRSRLVLRWLPSAHKANQTMLLKRIQMVGDSAKLAGGRSKRDRLEEERGRWVRQANWMARVTGQSLVRKDTIGGELE